MAINKLSTVQGFNTPSRIGGATITDTATGNYTSGGVTYDYWTFTGNGTLNVVTAGYADVLVVGGGGGGGGADRGGGGGGGGHLEVTNTLDRKSDV